MDFWGRLRALREAAQTDPKAAQNALDSLFRDTAHSRMPEDAERLALLMMLATREGLEKPDRVGSPSRDYVALSDTSVRTAGVSLIAVCTTDEAPCPAVLATWLSCPDIAEIILIDWSSDVAVRDRLNTAGVDDPKIRVYRVLGERDLRRATALNVGLRLARHDRVLSLPAGTRITPGFFEANPLAAGEFRADTLAEGGDAATRAIYGHTDDLLSVGGSSEALSECGGMDEDLCRRLLAAGFNHTGLRRDTLRCAAFPGGKATASETLAANAGEDTAIAGLRCLPHHKRRFNALQAALLPDWSPASALTPFKIRWDGDRSFLLRRTAPAQTGLPEETDHMLHLLAAYDHFGEAHPRIYDLSPDQMHSLLSSHRLEDIDAARITAAAARDAGMAVSAAQIAPSRRRRIFADLQHGLGNRLRTWASAAQVADGLDAELVTIWQPDEHCDCRLQDLFEFDGAVIEERFITGARAAGFDVYNYLEGEDGGLKDEPVRSTPDNDIYVRSSGVLNSPLVRHDALGARLAALSPARDVRDMVTSVRHPNWLSVHVRMASGEGFSDTAPESVEIYSAGEYDEATRWRAASHHDAFIARIDRLAERTDEATLFLAADTQAAYDAFRGRYGARVAMLDRAVFDRSALQLKYALADMILLGQATIMLGSTWSSFSEVARMMSPHLKRVEMSGIDF